MKYFLYVFVSCQILGPLHAHLHTINILSKMDPIVFVFTSKRHSFWTVRPISMIWVPLKRSRRESMLVLFLIFQISKTTFCNDARKWFKRHMILFCNMFSLNSARQNMYICYDKICFKYCNFVAHIWITLNATCANVRNQADNRCT